MLDQLTLAAFAEHGDTWCLDIHGLSRFIAGGERKVTPRLPTVKGAIAVIPMHGVITKRGGWFSDGLDRIKRTTEAALASKAIGAVVFDQDTPGGSSYGLMEFADWVYSLRGGKPIISVANPLSASAGIWAGTSADQMIVTPSGDVGSVGVWSLHVDYSQMLEQSGIKPTFVFAGKYKVESHGYAPLTDDARAEIQRGVDECYVDFIAAMARNRGVAASVVKSDFGEGRVMGAQRAKDAGLVDRVASLDEVLSAMVATVGSTSEATSRDASQMLAAAWSDELKPEATGQHVESLKRRRERERTR